jgi:hypothetical protein
MPILAQTTILPGWLVLPFAAVTMLVVATHVLATHAGSLPPRRRRLRIANGIIMMFVTALLAYALGVAAVVEDPTAQPTETRSFVTIWLAIIGLVGLVVALACADAVATVAHGWGIRRDLRREMRTSLRADLAERRASQAPSVQGPARGGR